MPQQEVEPPQASPRPAQLRPLPQIPPEQERELQHCEELVHEEPMPLQPEAPVQVPFVQLKVPQHCEELVQKVPELWQLPPEQTLLALQVSTPQQSPLDWQRWLSVWQGPVRFGSGDGSDGVEQARASATGTVRRARRIQVERVMGVVYLRFRGPSRAL